MVPAIIAAAGLGTQMLGTMQQSKGIKQQIADENRIREEQKAEAQRLNTGIRTDVQGKYDPYTGLKLSGIEGMQNYQETPYEEFRYAGRVDDFMDPSLNYQQDQAARTMQQNQVAGGMAQSGAALKALNAQTSNIAQTGYNNAYNQMAQERDRQYGVHRDTYATKIAAANAKYGRDKDIMDIGDRAIDNSAQADYWYGGQMGAANRNNAPQSSAGTGSQIWGQTMTGAGDAALKLSGNMFKEEY
jgi:hypothetical protein